MATPVRPAPAAAAPPARPPSSPLPPPPPPLHHDTTLTLALALPPSPFVCAITSPRPRPPADGGGGGVAAARVRWSPQGDPPPCTECGKQFSSWKALFGHMRCHPERQWRGMTPSPSPRFHHHQFTVQERETATSLLMLSGTRPAGSTAKGKKSILGVGGATPSAKVMSCGGASTSASSPPAPTVPAPAPPLPRCDDHKCSVCSRGFATGQALGGHKRCHWEKTTAACAVGTAAAVATSSSGGCSASATSSSQMTPATTLELDLNLPPPRMQPPLARKSDQGGSLDATLDLKLGF